MAKFILVFVSLLVFQFFISCKDGSSADNQQKDTVQITNIDSSSFELEELNKMILEDPNNKSLYLQRGKLFVKNLDLESAENDFKRILKIDSNYADAYSNLADIYLMRGTATAVKSILETGLTKVPGNDDLKLKLAELQLYLKNYKECILALDDVLKSNKYNAKAYYIKGMAFKEMGDTAKSVSSFQTAVEQDPDYYHAYLQLAALFATDYNPIALQYFNSAIKLNPTSTEALYGAGLFYQEMGNVEKALEAYDIILKIDPMHFDAYYNSGFVHSEMLKDYNTAIKFYTDAINVDNKQVKAFYMRGYAFERLKDKKQAENNYRMALGIQPDYTLAAEGLNRIL